MRSLGEQVQEFLDGEGITAAQLAKQLGESRQNLENLVAGRAGMPKYLLALSMAMRASADELLAGRYRYRASGTPAAAAPGASYVVEVWPFTRLTREEWAELGPLQAVVEDAAVNKARELLREVRESGASKQKRRVAGKV